MTETNRGRVHTQESLIEKYLQYNDAPLVSEDIYWLHKPCTMSFVSFLLISCCIFVFYGHVSVDIVAVLNQSWEATNVYMKIDRHGFNFPPPSEPPRGSDDRSEATQLSGWWG